MLPGFSCLERYPRSKHLAPRHMGHPSGGTVRKAWLRQLGAKLATRSAVGTPPLTTRFPTCRHVSLVSYLGPRCLGRGHALLRHVAKAARAGDCSRIRWTVLFLGLRWPPVATAVLATVCCTATERSRWPSAAGLGVPGTCRELMLSEPPH